MTLNRDEVERQIAETLFGQRMSSDLMPFVAAAVYDSVIVPLVEEAHEAGHAMGLFARVDAEVQEALQAARQRVLGLVDSEHPYSDDHDCDDVDEYYFCLRSHENATVEAAANAVAPAPKESE